MGDITDDDSDDYINSSSSKHTKSGEIQIDNSFISDDSEEDFNQVRPRTRKANIIESDEEDEDADSEQDNGSDPEEDFNQASRRSRKANIVESDEEDEDADSEQDNGSNSEGNVSNSSLLRTINSNKNPETNSIRKSSKLEETVDDDSDSEDEPKISQSSSIRNKKSLNNSARIGYWVLGIGYFGKRGSILNSTEIGSNIEKSLESTPTKVTSSDEPTYYTPKANTVREVETISSRSPSPTSTSHFSDDIVEVSSDDDVIPVDTKKKLTQTTLDGLVKVTPQKKILEVSPNEYTAHRLKIGGLEMQINKTKNMLRTINLNALPDKGQALFKKEAEMQQLLKLEQEKLHAMVINKENAPAPPKLAVNWDQIAAGTSAVQPRTFGKQALSTYNAQKTLTLDRLQQLHGSMANCPKEDDIVDDPDGLKVELMVHQKRGLAWLLWREKQKPSGGILADDMGLGKTLTMISLMLKTKPDDKNKEDSWCEKKKGSERSEKPLGGTLVVCPASLINQWSGEVTQRTRRGLVSFNIYHGANREAKPRRLAEHDMVITTYSIIMNEHPKNGTVFRVKWRRIILDEAHQIRNHKSQTSVAVCELSAVTRWALTGTPVHNKEMDMYALLKFLRVTPFDDLQVWKRWVGDKSTGGQERLHTVIASLMLRRTKAELMTKSSLFSLPARKSELISIELNKNEMEIYQAILIFSRTLFAQFLHQKAENNQDVMDARSMNNPTAIGPNSEYFKMRQKLMKLNKVKDVSQHEILVLLLRLRQICCHPSLITSMLSDSADDLDGDDEEYQELNLLEQLKQLTIDDDDEFGNQGSQVDGNGAPEGPVGLKHACKPLLNPSNPVFSQDHNSAKIKELLKVLKEKVLDQNDKAIVVSQWTSFLLIIAKHLKRNGVCFQQLDGTIPVQKRMAIVDNFNNPTSETRVLLLSLTAGGVGLNLTGANHLLLLDLHWNPQLENQAQDRIYRMGQGKPVFVYKFIATETVEQRIYQIQEKKLGLAQAMLTGSKQAISTKLSLQDLRMLFEM